MRDQSNLDHNTLEDNKLATYLESLIFVAASPVSLKDLTISINAYLMTSLSTDDIAKQVDSLTQKYDSEEYSFGIRKINGGYAFMTKGAYHELNGQVLKRQNNKKLTRTALETISIIAYKQPITKGEIESIRGVSSDYSVQKLMEKELIEITGRSEALGKPLLYGTSPKFMDHFGLNSIDDLPKLKELKLEEYDDDHTISKSQGERASDSTTADVAEITQEEE